MGRDSPDHLNRADAMGDGHHRVTVHALARRPFAPLAVHLPSRITQDSIQIKQNGSAGKSSHVIDLTTRTFHRRVPQTQRTALVLLGDSVVKIIETQALTGRKAIWPDRTTPTVVARH